MSKPLLGIDIGGTFTDFVCWQDGVIRSHKVLSTPEAPEQAILQGIDELGLSLEALSIIHGSTIATNAVLERKGAKTVFVTNQGFKDVLLIGRQTRKQLYNLTPAVVEPLVAREHCLEINCRMTADGSELKALCQQDFEQLLSEIQQLEPEAVAISLLFAYLDGKQEQQLAELMPAELFISCSHQVLPEYREYERGMTTWLNSYVGPLVKQYLGTLQQQLQPASLSVMKSSGQTSSAGEAGQEAVHLLLSGPAGGLCAAELLSQFSASKGFLTFDMGGTSTDVALYDGQIPLTNQGEIAGYPVAVPMTEIHTIGAGGGSIAYLDTGGALQVGPESAGADPGPVCYGRGGTRVTVTDANLILGRIPAQTPLAGNMMLDANACRHAMQQLAQEAGLADAETLAEGIIKIANQAMSQALSRISLERGKDPRLYSLLAFGGAGGLHVCALAESLGMTQALVPAHSGVLSALGMMAAPRGRELSKTLQVVVHENAAPTAELIEQAFQSLQAEAEKALVREGLQSDELQYTHSVDLCFKGQASHLNIPWHDIHRALSDFKQLYEQRYGYLLEGDIECVNIRLRAQQQDLNFEIPEYSAPANIADTGSGSISRQQLAAMTSLRGPAVVCDSAATLWVAADWSARVDRYGNISLQKQV